MTRPRTGAHYVPPGYLQIDTSPKQHSQQVPSPPIDGFFFVSAKLSDSLAFKVVWSLSTPTHTTPRTKYIHCTTFFVHKSPSESRSAKKERRSYV